MLVAIDIDGVLADIGTQIFQILGEPENKTVYDLYQAYPESVHDRISELIISPYFYWSMDKSVGALDFMYNLLKQGHTAMYMTMRPDGMQRVTVDWLAFTNFPVLSIIFAGDFGGKVPLLRKMGCDILVDDCPEIAADFAQYGTSIIVQNPEWPYGYSDYGDAITVENLQQAAEVIQRAAK